MKQALEKLSNEKINKWPNFFDCISEELKAVEDNLCNKMPIQSKLLSEIIKHIFLAGGKRFRPALSLLIAKATGSIKQKHIKVAELTELIHTASLIHDDIIDSATTRRGKETINNLWNDKISVIAGDFLFAQASVRLGELENTEIVKIYAQVLSDLCEGEIDQYSQKFNPEIGWDYYIEKSTAKTASLIAAGCKGAAIINNQKNEIIEKSNLYGKFLGIAFQIVDDILDFTSTQLETGKNVGEDLKQGIITAPTIYALEQNNPKAKELKRLIEGRFEDSNSFLKAITIIHELNGIEASKELAQSYIFKAKDSINFISDNEIKQHLQNIADYVINRINN